MSNLEAFPLRDNTSITGGASDTVSSNAPYSGILSGMHNLIQDTEAVIAGGAMNSILYTTLTHPAGVNCFIGAGTHNTIDGATDFPIRKVNPVQK
jgi:hypothetical protein